MGAIQIIQAVVVILSSMLITWLSIPSVIGVSRLKRLFDGIDRRKSHSTMIPRLGGIAIASSWFITTMLWQDFASLNSLQYIVASAMVLCLMTLRDDLIPLGPALLRK